MKALEKQATFFKLLKANPNEAELNKVFAMYRKETGRHQDNMSFADQHRLLMKLRNQK